MGMDLIAKKKGVDSFYMGSFSWSWMLEAGVGLVIGYGRAMNPSDCIYQERLTRSGKSRGMPTSNDGYPITAKEAKMMAAAARGLVSVQRFINQQWDTLTEEERKRREQPNVLDVYKKPVREDFIEKAERFAEWAERSGGFNIH